MFQFLIKNVPDKKINITYWIWPRDQVFSAFYHYVISYFVILSVRHAPRGSEKLQIRKTGVIGF
jgi:hypothetical protein